MNLPFRCGETYVLAGYNDILVCNKHRWHKGRHQTESGTVWRKDADCDCVSIEGDLFYTYRDRSGNLHDIEAFGSKGMTRMREDGEA